jgi:hypothetical protein
LPLSDVQSLFQEQFTVLAREETRFHATLCAVLGENLDARRAEQLRRKALAGDFAWLPPVKWLGLEVLGGARGVYDPDSGTVFLHRALLRSPPLAARAYVEQVGQFLDVQLNGVDTLRDEGELFRAILTGERLPPERVSAVRARPPHAAVRAASWSSLKLARLLVASTLLGMGGMVAQISAQAWAMRR